MTAFESHLANRLHDLVDDELDSAPPTRQVLDRGRRGRRRRAATLAGTSFAVVALGAVAAAFAWTPSTAPGGVQPGAAAMSATTTDARLDLVAAVANSQNISFRLTTTATGQKGDGKTTVPESTWVTETAFDPATATGYLRCCEGGFEYRLVNGVLYMTNGAQWLRQPGTHTSLNMDEDKLRGAFVESADAQQLFVALRSGGKVEKTGPDTYRFAATSSKNEGTVTFTGDVVVGADERIAKVTYDWRLDSKQGGFQQSKVVLEYSGYGETVTVEAPPNPVPVD